MENSSQTILLQNSHTWADSATHNLVSMIYGMPEEQISPLTMIFEYGEILKEENSSLSNFNPYTVYIRSLDLVFWLHFNIVEIIDKYLSNRLLNSLNGDEIKEMIFFMNHVQLFHLYDRYYYSIFITILPRFQENLDKQQPFSGELTILLCVIVIICDLIFFALMKNSETGLKFALYILFHCPDEIILSNSHIMRILSGKFATKTKVANIRNSIFFEQLVQELPDSIIILTENGIIKTINKATERILGM
jgi:PAS domain-containing protein